MINKLKEHIDLTITSTTGVSSHLIKGQTIHSFSGIGVLHSKYTLKDVIKKIKKNKDAKRRITECDLLVIDEISMLGATYLSVLSESFKLIRKNENVFGGIQVIMTGDFYQLPPIHDNYAFESETWKELELHTILLEKVYRFTDEVYSNMLSRIRKGEHLPEDNVELFKRVKEYKEQNIEEFEIQPTFLSCKKVDVFEKNKEELDKNKNEVVFYLSEDEYKSESIVSCLDLLSPKKLELKVGAQVMLTVNKNVEEGLVNGSRGVIVELTSNEIYVKFLKGHTIPFERHLFQYEEEGKVLGTRFQFPFILAYCLTIHKIQGSTIDCAIIDIGNSIFENHMSYVALSRVKSLNGLYLKAFNPYKIKVDQKVEEFYKNLI
jgi:ATP-dependent DNA helicase PIF1